MSATSDHGLPCFFSQYPILRTDAVQKICVQVVLRELLECPASASWLKRKFCGCPQRPIFKRCSRREDHALAEEFSLRAHAARILKSQKGLGTAIRCQSRRKKGPFAGVKVGQLRCRALLGVLPIKLTRDKAHVGQRPTSIKFRPGSGSGVSALF